jgi:hypothetical protein
MERTFVIKAVNTIYAGAFMVTAKNKEVFGILDFVRQEEANRF